MSFLPTSRSYRRTAERSIRQQVVSTPRPCIALPSVSDSFEYRPLHYIRVCYGVLCMHALASSVVQPCVYECLSLRLCPPVQLNGVVEHADYASFGFYVSSPFAISSRFGTPEEFHALVDAAHGLGLRVLLTLYHSHSSRNALEGLGSMDGCSETYFMGGEKVAENAEWGEAKLFDYRKTEVLRYLLSNLKFFLTEFKYALRRFTATLRRALPPCLSVGCRP